MTPKMTKNPKLTYFQSFDAFFLTFEQTSSIATSKRVKKERTSCPVRLEKR